jgi:hypothetical protein
MLKLLSIFLETEWSVIKCETELRFNDVVFELDVNDVVNFYNKPVADFTYFGFIFRDFIIL